MKKETIEALKAADNGDTIKVESVDMLMMEIELINEIKENAMIEIIDDRYTEEEFKKLIEKNTIVWLGNLDNIFLTDDCDEPTIDMVEM